MTQIRQTQPSVNCLIYYIDKNKQKWVLLVKRSSDKKVNPNVINTLGGRVDKYETYAEAAIREAREETGDKKEKFIPEKLNYKGTFRFVEGFAKDWIAQFFAIQVKSKVLPIKDMETREGTLLWIKADEVLSKKNIIEDLPYIWQELISDNLIFSVMGTYNEKEEVVRLKKVIMDKNGKIIEKKDYPIVK